MSSLRGANGHPVHQLVRAKTTTQGFIHRERLFVCPLPPTADVSPHERHAGRHHQLRVRHLLAHWCVWCAPRPASRSPVSLYGVCVCVCVSGMPRVLACNNDASIKEFDPETARVVNSYHLEWAVSTHTHTHTHTHRGRGRGRGREHVCMCLCVHR